MNPSLLALLVLIPMKSFAIDSDTIARCLETKDARACDQVEMDKFLSTANDYKPGALTSGQRTQLDRWMKSCNSNPSTCDSIYDYLNNTANRAEISAEGGTAPAFIAEYRALAASMLDGFCGSATSSAREWANQMQRACLARAVAAPVTPPGDIGAKASPTGDAGPVAAPAASSRGFLEYLGVFLALAVLGAIGKFLFGRKGSAKARPQATAGATRPAGARGNLRAVPNDDDDEDVKPARSSNSSRGERNFLLGDEQASSAGDGKKEKSKDHWSDNMKDFRFHGYFSDAPGYPYIIEERGLDVHDATKRLKATREKFVIERIEDL